MRSQVGQVRFVGALRPDRLPLLVRIDRPIVVAVREVAQPLGGAADDLAQLLERPRADVHELLDAVLAQPLARSSARPPTARRPADPGGSVSIRSGAITVRPSGLCQPDAIFGEKLVRRDARRGGQAGRLPDRLLDAPGDGHPERLAPRVLGDVEIRLVERQRLDERRDAAIDGEHLLRDAPILLKVRPDDDERRAETHGARHRNAPSARRRSAPRSWRRRPRRASSDRRRRRRACPRSAGLSRCSTDA